MVISSPKFTDTQDNWARLFIEALAQRGIISGFPNGTFRPSTSMTRAQFAAILSKAFPTPSKRQYVPFIDVPKTYWAATAIQKAYESGFLSGYPNNRFSPEDRITRAQVLLALVSGLGITVDPINQPKVLLTDFYLDAAAVPNYAIEKLIIATQVGLVVNYPNLKILNPNLAATRADVAAFIYQALVYLRQVSSLPSDYIIPQVIKVSHTREFRGTWVATVWNSDWPSKPGLPIEQQKAELIQILDRLADLHFNALVFQVRPEGDALYTSQLEPWSAWLTGTQGKPPEPFYDPLEFVIAEGRKRNIEIHAWFNPYRANTSSKTTSNISPHIAVTNPDFVYQYGNQLWMDPGAKVVQDRAFNVILDVVRRYDVAGIHLDDYFYPYPISGTPFPDNKTYAAYQADGGKLPLEDWRRENVNQLIQRLLTGIQAAKPQVKFGISPFGIYRPGQPEQIRGLDAYNALYADSKKWLEQGWIDYLSPQLYWRIDPPAQSYPVLLKWWAEQNLKQKHIYPGNNLGQLDGKAWTLEEIQKQVAITRTFAPVFVLGNIFFSMEAFNENRQGISDSFKTSTYSQPALVPVMQWRDTTPPVSPKAVGVTDGKLSWKLAEKAAVRSWTLYQQKPPQDTNPETWTLLKVIPGETMITTVEPGMYALCAVDQLANESVGVVVSVSAN
jgi:uncharacterized lipoprotein YddW (UPF0748 family)